MRKLHKKTANPKVIRVVQKWCGSAAALSGGIVSGGLYLARLFADRRQSPSEDGTATPAAGGVHMAVLLRCRAFPLTLRFKFQGAGRLGAKKVRVGCGGLCGGCVHIIVEITAYI
jgi:hypothetical protein